MIKKICPRFEVKMVRSGSESYEIMHRTDVINSSSLAKQIVGDIVRSSMEDSPVELFGVITLDTKLKPIGYSIVTKGTLDVCLVHPREVFLIAISQMASTIIVVHNHPSGDLTPSREDFDVTKKLKAAGEILGIKVIDHIIVGRDDYGSWNAVSMADTIG